MIKHFLQYTVWMGWLTLVGKCWRSNPDDWNYDASYEGESEGGAMWDQSAMCPNCESESFSTEGNPWTPNYFYCYDCEHKSKEWNV